MASDSLKREFYCKDDEGKYGTFEYIVVAPSASDIRARYPSFAVVPLEQLGADELVGALQLRYFPGPGRRRDAAVAHLGESDRQAFLSAQQRAWEEVRRRYAQAGPGAATLRDPSELQLWIDIDDDGDFHRRRYGN